MSQKVAMWTGFLWKLCHPLSQLCLQFGHQRLKFGPRSGVQRIVGRLRETQQILQHAYHAEKFAFLTTFGLAFFKSCLHSSVLVEFPFQPCIVVTALVWRS